MICIVPQLGRFGICEHILEYLHLGLIIVLFGRAFPVGVRLGSDLVDVKLGRLFTDLSPSWRRAIIDWLIADFYIGGLLTLWRQGPHWSPVDAESTQRKVSVLALMNKRFCFRCNFTHLTILLLDILVLREDRRRMLNVLTEVTHVVIGKALIELHVGVALYVANGEARGHELPLLARVEGVASRGRKLG